MKIFGFEFTTKKELKSMLLELYDENDALIEELEDYEAELDDIRTDFPFDLGQVVFDVALKDAKGRYTKTAPVFAYSTITEVTVDEKNYFSLVERFKRNDVFLTREAAENYLQDVCD